MNESDKMHKLVAASSGAFVTSLVVTPFDVIKTRMQTFALRSAKPDGCKDVYFCQCFPTKSLVPSGGYSSSWRTMNSIIRSEGMPGLWKGLQPALATSVPATTLYYVWYEQLREKIDSPLICGIVARTCAVCVISPLELVRTRIQGGVMKKEWKGILQDLRIIVAERGFLALFAGIKPTLLRDVPFSGIYWFGYERLREELTMMQEYQRSFVAGACSGLVAAFVTTPLDVIKTRVQVELHKDKSIRKLAKRILATEGWRGLMMGTTARMAKIAPSCAIMITSYEVGKAFLQDL